MMRAGNIPATATLSSPHDAATTDEKRKKRIPASIPIAGAIVYFIVLFHCRDVISLGFCCLLATATAVRSGIRPQEVRRALMPFFLVALTTTIMQVLFCNEGDALISIGGFSFHEEGISSALVMVVRLACLMVMSASLARRLDFRDAAKSISRLLAPLRRIGIRTDAFSLAFETAMRFLPILLEEFEKDWEHRRDLGADADRGFRKKLLLLEDAFSLLISSSYARIDQVAQEYLADEASAGDSPEVHQPRK